MVEEILALAVVVTLVLGGPLGLLVRWKLFGESPDEIIITRDKRRGEHDCL